MTALDLTAPAEQAENCKSDRHQRREGKWRSRDAPQDPHGLHVRKTCTTVGGRTGHTMCAWSDEELCGPSGISKKRRKTISAARAWKLLEKAPEPRLDQVGPWLGRLSQRARR